MGRANGNDGRTMSHLDLHLRIALGDILDAADDARHVGGCLCARECGSLRLVGVRCAGERLLPSVLTNEDTCGTVSVGVDEDRSL